MAWYVDGSDMSTPSWAMASIAFSLGGLRTTTRGDEEEDEDDGEGEKMQTSPSHVTHSRLPPRAAAAAAAVSESKSTTRLEVGDDVPPRMR